MNIQPVIKWTGSKRTQAEKIIGKFPSTIETYYEPFLGGGSVFGRLLFTKYPVKKYVLSDINKDLIDLWKLIQFDHLSLAESYEQMWSKMKEMDDIEDKKNFYYSVRERFNNNKSPHDFMFIMRTTVNGMPRYNRSGFFNNAFHVTRDGIHPKTLSKILASWSARIKQADIRFVAQSYSEIDSDFGDVVYIDPPYAGTKGIYYGTIEYEKLWKWIRKQSGKCYLSFDGKTTSQDNTYKVPQDIYRSHEYLESGNSSFRRVIGKSKTEYVKESLYIK